jgi:hypothetical protein
MTTLRQVFDELSDEELRARISLIQKLHPHREEWHRRLASIESIIRKEGVPSIPDVRLASVPLGCAWNVCWATASECNPKAQERSIRLMVLKLMFWFLGGTDEHFIQSFSGSGVLEGHCWYTTWCARAEWASLAFPTVALSSSVASSLVATAGDSCPDAHAPWGSFAIALPEEDPWGGTGVWVQRVLTTVEAGDIYSVLSENALGGSAHINAALCANLERLNRIDAALSPMEQVQDSLEERGFHGSTDNDRHGELTSKLTASVILALTSETATLTKRLPRARGLCKVTHSELKGGTYVLGLPVKCDLTKEVSDWVAGRTKSITRSAVRWLVRGHWRQQACGLDMKDHRRTWIAPYWKGPERAAALVRPHVIGEQDPDDASPVVDGA